MDRSSFVQNLDLAPTSLLEYILVYSESCCGVTSNSVGVLSGEGVAEVEGAMYVRLDSATNYIGSQGLRCWSKLIYTQL